MKTVAIKLEGTLSTGADVAVGEAGTPNPKAVELCNEYATSRRWRVVVVSGLCNYGTGLQIARQWLFDVGVQYDELWCGQGYPFADRVIDFQAVRDVKEKP